MLIDLAQQYDPEKTKYLRDLREKTILHLATSNDPKKIFSFLTKVWIVDIDEKEKMIYIWVSNEFIYTQVNKFFQKPIKEAIKSVYNPQFGVKIIIYPPFLKSNDLLVDLKKILKISNKPQPMMTQKEVKSGLAEHFGILFDPVFRFDSFVVGANTTIAFSAAKAVAEQPGMAYNPLFLYGNVGLGKTHLMQAIWNEIMEYYPEKVVVYFPATKLIDEIISATRTNKLANLYKKFEEVGVLMIDDIQFLAEKEKTQEIFHTIFNDFQMQKKQVILSSDRPPKELQHIEPRLKSRFALWLVADIQAPDLETRIAILQTKLAAKGESLEFELLNTVAKYIKDNVRELEGALNILLTRKKVLWVEIGEEDVIECLKTLGYSPESPNFPNQVVNVRWVQNFTQLVEMVASYYSISVADLKSDSRTQEVTQPRQMLMYLAKKHFNWTFEKIGDFFGWKNHASVIYAVDNISKKLKHNEDVQHDHKVFLERMNS